MLPVKIVVFGVVVIKLGGFNRFPGLGSLKRLDDMGAIFCDQEFE